MKSKIISLVIASAIVSSSLFGHSKALKPEFVDMLLKPYFELQTSLTKDDLAASKTHAASFNTMLGHGPSFKEAPSLEGLSTESSTISSAQDLATARAAFQTISKNFATLVQHVGTTGAQSVYQLSCPMAFDGKGGEWLQNNKSVANPYFGSMMFSCGAVKQEIGQGKAE